MIRRSSIVLLALLLVSRASAQTSEPLRPVIESRGNSYLDFKTRELVFPDKARLTYGDVLLTADEVRYNSATGIAVARGHVIMTRGAQRLVADLLTYHFSDGTYEATDLRVGEFPIYLSGASATGDRDSITIKDARASMPEPGPLVPSLRASTLVIGADHHLHAEHASAGLGTVRPIAFGSFRHDLNDPVVSYLSFNGGYRGSLGVFAVAGLHVPVSDTFNLGGDLGVYSRRGIMVGPSGTYTSKDGGQTYTGSFRSGYIHDYGPRYTDLLGDAVPDHRGYAEWTHDQQLTDRLTLSAQLNYWRDSEILRDFRPSAYNEVQQPDTFVESVYTGNNYFVSAFVRAAPNNFEVVQERLPEVRFDLLPTAIGGGVYERFNASAVALRDAPPDGGPTLRSDRLDAYYGLSRPITHADWLSFTPVAGGRITQYLDTQGAADDGDYTRVLGEVGFDAALRMSGTFDYQNPRWKIDGLRHLFTPKISYRYIPKADKGTPYIPPIDRLSFSTYLQPLGLGDQRNIDQLRDTNTLRFEIDNTIQTRDDTYGSRDLVVFNVANDLRFARLPGERDVSEIHTELGVMPARWLELGLYQRFTPQDFTLQELNTGITLQDGQAWTLRFANNFLRRELEDYLVDGNYRINEVYEGILHLRYNARRGRFDEQAYGIRQKLGTTWRLDYIVTLYDGPRRESRFGFNLRIEALSF